MEKERTRLMKTVIGIIVGIVAVFSVVAMTVQW